MNAKTIFVIIRLSAYILTHTGATAQFEFYSKRSINRLTIDL
jgi:hypothetical protein